MRHRFIVSRVLALTLSVSLLATGCAGGGGSSQQDTPQGAGMRCLSTNCTVVTQLNASITDGGIVSTASGNSSNYTFTGAATNGGTQFGTFSGSTSLATGVNTVTANVPSVSSSPITFSYLDASRIQEGTNSLPGGGTLSVDTASNSVTATVKDPNGVVWTLTGAMESDNEHVLVTASSTSGTFTTTLDANAYGPQAAASNSTLGSAGTTGAARAHPMLDLGPVASSAPSPATQVAAVAGGVAAVAGLLAFGAGALGLGPAALVFGGIAAVAACVSAGAVIANVFFGK